MGILIADNFNYKGKKPLDERIVYNLLSDMKAVTDSIIYEGAIAYCKEDKKFYTFDPANTVDATTGKWRELQLGGSGNASIEDYAQNTQYKKNGLLLYDNKIYLVTADFTSDNTQTTLADSFNLDLTNSKFVPVDTDTNCVEYAKNTKYKKDTLVYNSETLARVVSDFTSDNTATSVKDSFELDISNSKLLVVSSVKVLDRIKSNTKLTNTIGSTTTIAIANLPSTTINDIKKNQLVYDIDGTVGFVSSIDTTNNEVTVITITKSGDNKTIRYESDVILNKTILKQTTINFTDLNTLYTVSDLKENQLVYDAEGTIAKIDSINTTPTGTTIDITTLTTSSENFEMRYYKYDKDLDRNINQNQLLSFADINATTINDLEVNQIIFDEKFTISKI